MSMFVFHRFLKSSGLRNYNNNNNNNNNNKNTKD